MDAAPLHRRPRPVADAPVRALADGVAMTKSWLVMLLGEAPLHRAAAVPMADLARGGPALCAAILDAVRSDEDLERLATGDRAPLAACAGRFAGARGAPETSAAVEALRRASWGLLLAELRDPPPMLVAELGDRLAHVCATVAFASLGLPTPDPPPPPAAQPHPDPPARYVRVPAATPPAFPRDDPAARAAEPGRWVDVDAPGGAPAEGGATVTHLPHVDRVGEVQAGPVVAQPGSPAIVDADAGQPPWRAAVQRRLDRRSSDGLPFGVLAVEIDDLERLVAAESGREVAHALEAAERGLTAQLAPADVVVRERLGRWWLTAPERDVHALRELATRIAGAIAGAQLAGAPLKASIGMAACPDDGEDVDALTTTADQALFAARAAGLRLA